MAEFRQSGGGHRAVESPQRSGEMVPIGTVARLKDKTIPTVCHATIYFRPPKCKALPHRASRPARRFTAWRSLLIEVLPQGIGFEWTELVLSRATARNSDPAVFGAAALFVFLVLSAQYENWKLPLAIVLIVPMCLLASDKRPARARACRSTSWRKSGFIVLVGLAAKNAILIVEFARQREDRGLSGRRGASACRATRLRPILMTSFAFILGVARWWSRPAQVRKCVNH